MTLDTSAILKGIGPALANGRSEAHSAPQPPVVETAAPAASTTRASAPPPDISHQIEKLTRALQESHSNLSFSVDESTGKTVVRIVRSSTGELVRQIPSEEALAIAASLTPGEPLSSLGIDRWT